MRLVCGWRQFFMPRIKLRHISYFKQPLVRPKPIANWKAPYPEVQWCDEGYCTSEFVNKSKSGKVKRIIYEYCGHPYGGNCAFINLKGFLRTYSDEIISRKKSDENYESARQHFE